MTYPTQVEVTGTLYLPTNEPAIGYTVEATPTSSLLWSDSGIMQAATPSSTVTGADGTWALTLNALDDSTVSPKSQAYIWTFQVPSGGTNQVFGDTSYFPRFITGLPAASAPTVTFTSLIGVSPYLGTLTLTYNTHTAPCQVMSGLAWNPADGGFLLVVMPSALTDFGVDVPAFAYVDDTGTIQNFSFIFTEGNVSFLYNFGPTGNQIAEAPQGLTLLTSSGNPGDDFWEFPSLAGMVVGDGSGGFWSCTSSAPSSTWVHLTAAGGGTPGGSNQQLQFNNDGAFGGTPTITWDGTNLIFADTANLFLTTENDIGFNGESDELWRIRRHAIEDNGILSDTELRLLLPATAEGFSVENQAGTPLFQVRGSDGAAYIAGPLQLGPVRQTFGLGGSFPVTFTNTTGKDVLLYDRCHSPGGSDTIEVSIQNLGDGGPNDLGAYPITAASLLIPPISVPAGATVILEANGDGVNDQMSYY